MITIMIILITLGLACTFWRHGHRSALLKTPGRLKLYVIDPPNHAK